MSDSTSGPEDSPESREVEPAAGTPEDGSSVDPDRSANVEGVGPDQVPAQQIRAAAFSGPLPPPPLLEAYEDIEPGLADRIVTMAEEQSEHRRGLEQSVVNGNLKAQNRGQWFALILGLAGAALAGLLIWKDQFWWGVGLFLVELISLAGLFLIGRKRAGDEIEEKQAREGRPPGAEQRELPFGDDSGTGDG